MVPALAPLGITSLIFGGCCSNVYTLEAIVRYHADSGLLITVGQFIFIFLCVWPTQFDATQPSFLKRTSVPFHKWAVSAVMFYTVNMLNNWAFSFNISVPVHIILRSFGSVTTMAAGWLNGKKYSRIQIISVVVLTIGVIISAWADAVSKGRSMSTANIDISDTSFETGLAVLLAAQILSAFMGIYIQNIYATHGNANWTENLFYSHFLSLPLFLPLYPVLLSQYHQLANSAPISLSSTWTSILPEFLVRVLVNTPQAVTMLTLNSFTQLVCITGVYLLSAKSSAVTVTIVLNIRKLVSFIFSIWLFGNKMSDQMILGAALVFGSGALYGWETSVGIKRRQAKEKAQKTQKAGRNGKAL